MFSLYSFTTMFVTMTPHGMLNFVAIWFGSGLTAAAAGLWSVRRKDAHSAHATTHTEHAMLGASASVLGIVTAFLVPRPRMPLTMFFIVSLAKHFFLVRPEAHKLCAQPMKAWFGLSAFAAFSVYCEATGSIPSLGKILLQLYLHG